MKLIDLLVQELPKRGGWPDRALYVCRENDGTPRIVGQGWHDNKSLSTFKVSGDQKMVDKIQYESALAASQNPAWNGKGLPPVGCECEYISNGTSWGKVKVIGFDGEKIVIRPSGEIYYAITPSDNDVFTPLRTEAERKRDAFIDAVLDDMRTIPCDLSLRDEVAVIYDAIAAGKIPGVKLED